MNNAVSRVGQDGKVGKAIRPPMACRSPDGASEIQPNHRFGTVLGSACHGDGKLWQADGHEPGSVAVQEGANSPISSRSAIFACSRRDTQDNSFAADRAPYRIAGIDA